MHSGYIECSHILSLYVTNQTGITEHKSPTRATRVSPGSVLAGLQRGRGGVPGTFSLHTPHTTQTRVRDRRQVVKTSGGKSQAAETLSDPVSSTAVQAGQVERWN